MSVENVSYYEDFNEIEKKLWALLIRAVNDRSSEFRTPVFICGDKNNLDGRVVALDVTEQQNPYFRIAFEHARDGLPDAIKEAHLSIFQQFDPHTPALSAAHCTVLIKLSDTLFRFHLYFDEQEILIASHCDQQNAQMRNSKVKIFLKRNDKIINQKNQKNHPLPL